MEIELEDIERCFDADWSDGLPVIPPYQTLVSTMLEAIGWSAANIVGRIPAQALEIRAEQIAATAVLGGLCRGRDPALRG